VKTPNEIGDALEAKRAKSLSGGGGRRVPQSGAGKFYKLDITAFSCLVLSAKATTGKSIHITKGMLREAMRAARGILGHGDSYFPGHVTEVDGEIYLTLRLDDAIELLTNPEVASLPQSKAQERRARANASPLRR
jgi:hypothetical protein